MKKGNEGNPCLQCQAVCCQNVVMTLTDPEADLLRSVGTKLVKDEPGKPPFGMVGAIAGSLWSNFRGTNNYHMGRCGFLEEDRNGWKHCSIHEENRPRICSSLKAGSIGCTVIKNWNHMRNMGES